MPKKRINRNVGTKTREGASSNRQRRSRASSGSQRQNSMPQRSTLTTRAQNLREAVAASPPSQNKRRVTRTTTNPRGRRGEPAGAKVALLWQPRAADFSTNGRRKKQSK